MTANGGMVASRYSMSERSSAHYLSQFASKQEFIIACSSLYMKNVLITWNIINNFSNNKHSYIRETFEGAV